MCTIHSICLNSWLPAAVRSTVIHHFVLKKDVPLTDLFLWEQHGRGSAAFGRTAFDIVNLDRNTPSEQGEKWQDERGRDERAKYNVKQAMR